MKYAKGSGTSFLAAIDNLPKAGTQKARILFELNLRPLTRDDLEIHTGISGNAIRPRVAELIEAGLVKELPHTRRTRSGSQAQVLGVAKEIYAPHELLATNVGSSTEDRDQAGLESPRPVDADLGVASGVADEPSFPSEDYSAPPAISMYDCWEDAA